jgi:hypothetical protein
MENVQDAKSYLVKLYADKNSIKPSDIDEETKKRIWNNPKFLEVKDLMDKNKMPGNTFPFVKFAMDQRASMEQLEEIVELLKDNKNNLNSLPMTILEYSKIDRNKKKQGDEDEEDDDHRPGWEMLRDDLSNIERKRKLKNFIDRLTPRMKEYVTKKATTKQLEKLEEISNQLKLLPKNDEGREAWDAFFYPDLGVLNDHGKVKGRMGSYDDTITYTEYKDTSKAMEGIISDAESFISKWGEDEDAVIAKIKALGPQAGIIYARDGFLIMSARTPDAQRLVCSETGWCIRTDSTFWSYSSGRVQINVINNNIPTSERNSLVGITINKNETVHTDADRPNGRIQAPGGGNYTGKPATELLRRIGVPQAGIEAFERQFPKEANVKIVLENFFRNSGGLKPDFIVESLVSFNKGFLKGTLPGDEWEEISALISEIISDVEGLKPKDFLSAFLGDGANKSGGIFVEAAWNIFDKLVGADNVTDAQLKKMYEDTLDGYEALETLIELYDDNALPGVSKDDVEAMKTAYSYKDKSIAKFKKLMKDN